MKRSTFESATVQIRNRYKPFMKTALYILPILLILTGCVFAPKTPDQMIKDIQKDFAKEAKINNAETLAWKSLVDSLNKLSDTNQSIALKTIDHLVNVNTLHDRDKLSELHFIKGDIYYHVDSFEKSVDQFTIATRIIGFAAPKYLAARAGAYIKLLEFENALYDLTNAAEVNYSYYWNIGNYFEILGNKDSAIASYNRLYLCDTVFYRKCKVRILELEKPIPKFLTELIYDDRERIVLLMDSAN